MMGDASLFDICLAHSGQCDGVHVVVQWWIYIVKFWTPPNTRSKFCQFHAVFGKIWQNRMLVPTPGGLAPLPRGNSRSATVVIDQKMIV